MFQASLANIGLPWPKQIICHAADGTDVLLFVSSVGAQFPAIHGVLQRAAQRPQAELALSDVERRTCHQLFQKPIHTAGLCNTTAADLGFAGRGTTASASLNGGLQVHGQSL